MLHDPAFFQRHSFARHGLAKSTRDFRKKSFLCLKDYQVARDIQAQAPKTLAVSLKFQSPKNTETY
jgi:hypothetical protein